MKLFFLAFTFSLFGMHAHADHIPENKSWSPLTSYQHKASPKRYADIYKIATILEEYIQVTGAVPILGSDLIGKTPVYQVVALGQPESVSSIKENGTPFGFSLKKKDSRFLITVLGLGLGRDISLPIDPQKYGVDFPPAYFVFLRSLDGETPAHYVVLGTFGHPVKLSTNVAEGVHIVGISNLPGLDFIVPLIGLDEFDARSVAHILAEGAEADEHFWYYDTSMDEGAEHGDANAQFELGQMYDQGNGVPQDYVEAVKWYRLSAEQDHAKSQYALGSMYRVGDGVQQDASEAVKWFRLAAVQGLALAQNNLAASYEHGSGVIQDNESAYMWFSLASENGNKNSGRWLDELAAKMTAADINDSQRRARTCVASNYQDCD